MRRETIAMIWIGGAVLGVLLYVAGPDRVLDGVLDFFAAIDDAFRNLAFLVGTRVYGVVRAATIAIYVVFAILAFIASMRGQRGFWPLIVVTVVFSLLVWRPYYDGYTPISRWIAALALVTIGAAVMTQRLTAPPPNLPPYPMGRN